MTLKKLQKIPTNNDSPILRWQNQIRMPGGPGPMTYWILSAFLVSWISMQKIKKKENDFPILKWLVKPVLNLSPQTYVGETWFCLFVWVAAFLVYFPISKWRKKVAKNTNITEYCYLISDSEVTKFKIGFKLVTSTQKHTAKMCPKDSLLLVWEWALKQSESCPHIVNQSNAHGWCRSKLANHMKRSDFHMSWRYTASGASFWTTHGKIISSRRPPWAFPLKTRKGKRLQIIPLQKRQGGFWWRLPCELRTRHDLACQGSLLNNTPLGNERKKRCIWGVLDLYSGTSFHPCLNQPHPNPSNFVATSIGLP